MTKSQLDDYLASLRSGKNDVSPSHSRGTSFDDAEDRKSTPLVRALKERYGGTNVTVPYVPVSSPKGSQSPPKKNLPPIPGVKSENSFAWRRHRSSPSKDSQNDLPQPPIHIQGPERSPSPPRRNDFWTTGIPPTIITSPTRGQRPLPSSPRDPRDELRMPAIDEISLEDKSRPSPSINVPTIAEPADTVPLLNVPTINVPNDSEQETEKPANAQRSWPGIQVRSKSSPALFCSVCDRPIAGRIVTAVGRRFHPNCFRCETCQTELVNSHLMSLILGTRSLLRT